MLFKEMGNGELTHLGGDMRAIRSRIVTRIPPNIINDDTFIGITIKRKRVESRFCPECGSFIRSPCTPLEYITQRERVLIGHKQIEKTVGRFPPQ